MFYELDREVSGRTVGGVFGLGRFHCFDIGLRASLAVVQTMPTAGTAMLSTICRFGPLKETKALLQEQFNILPDDGDDLDCFRSFPVQPVLVPTLVCRQRA